jgi:hypothetical protein
MITIETASRFARLTLGHIGQEYPNMLVHMLAGPKDARTPSELHPIFHGSFDWHSCVHGWWQLLRLRRLFPEMREAAEITARADAMLVPDKVAGELAYLARPTSRGFERPYGWAWLLALHGEAARHDAPWATAAEPLARAFADRFHAHLPQLTYAIRSGAHFNTAFALVLALEWARDHDPVLADLILGRAQGWFGEDRAAQAWEPSGDDFLSPTLTEALLMSRLLDAPAFMCWFEAFLPEASAEHPATLFTPAHVSDRSDGKIAHLDGLNLSRAWCWGGIAAALGEDHPATPVAQTAAERHLAASLPHVEGDYMGEHWLATFALLALEPVSR